MNPFGGCGIGFAKLAISPGRGIMTITVFIYSHFGLGKQILTCGRPDKGPNGRVQGREEAKCRQISA